MADNCLGLAAQLAYYFFLALFPALLFLVAVISFMPVAGLLDAVTTMLARVAPGEVLSIVQEQIVKIANDKSGGLLTLGMLGTIWSTSSGMTAIIDTLNQAYDIQESRPWWKVRLMAIGLTIALAVFIVLSLALVLVGPTLAEKVAVWAHLGPAFDVDVEDPAVAGRLRAGDAGHRAHLLLRARRGAGLGLDHPRLDPRHRPLAARLARLQVLRRATSPPTPRPTASSAASIVLMLWFYVSALAVLVGAELNAEIEHASPYGKDPGEKVAGEKRKLGPAAERAWRDSKAAGTFKPALSRENCTVDADLLPAPPAPPRRTRFSDWVVTGLVVAETAALTYAKLRGRPERHAA